MNGSRGRKVTVIQPTNGWRAVDWTELWKHRDLFWVFARRDLKVRYRQTTLGILWAVIQPAVAIVVFSVIFGRFAKLPSEGLPYPVFVSAGLLPWTFFATAVTQAAQSLMNAGALIGKVYFPRLVIPASSVVVALVDFAFSFVVMAAVMLWYGLVPGPRAVFLVPVIAVTFAAAVGTGTLMAALIARYRDFRFVLPFVLQIWMYVTPVIYTPRLVPEDLRWMVYLNPMAGATEGFRHALLGTPLSWSGFALSAAVAAACLAAGVGYFRQSERIFADIL